MSCRYPTSSGYSNQKTSDRSVTPLKLLIQIVLLAALPLAAQTYSFPIKASANQRYFVDQNNVPWVMVADSAWDIVCNTDSSNWSTYITTRASQNYTAIFFPVLSNNHIQCTSGNSGSQAFDGAPPFTGGNSYATYDLSTPNPAYWSQIDDLVRRI